MTTFNRIKCLLLIALSLPLFSSGFSGKKDIEVLEKALQNALGEATNYGARRIVKLETSVIGQENILLILINEDRSFNESALRHNALTDAIRTLRIAKSWGWADKVDRVRVLETLIPQKGKEAHLFFSCSISSQALAKVDWTSVKPKTVQKYLDQAIFHEVKK
jgi:hypothetical protein